MKQLANLDEQLFQWIINRPANQAGKCIPTMFRYISKTGDGPLYLLTALALYCLDGDNGALFFYTALIAYSLEIPLYLILKYLCKRHRPCGLSLNFTAFIQPADKFSLPSGHTAAAFLMATIIADFYPQLGLVAFVWAALVACSRVVLRVHYPLDVLIGAGLGVSMATFCVYIFK